MTCDRAAAHLNARWDGGGVGVCISTGGRLVLGPAAAGRHAGRDAEESRGQQPQACGGRRLRGRGGRGCGVGARSAGIGRGLEL